MPLTLCVCGCGQFARTFVKAVKAFRGFEDGHGIDLFFASRDSKRARAFCNAFGGIDYFGSYEEAVADPRVQAVYFCTPHHLHMEHALMAARASKHILVEKPIARDLDEAASMISAAREAGVKLMVAENYRFMPMVQKARDLVQQGAVGQVRLIQIQEESNFAVEGWRASRDMMGGGVFIDGGIHSIAMLRDLAGEPEEVYAATLPRKVHNIAAEDGLVITVRLKGGSTGLINHAWGISRRSWKLWVAISGTEGRLFFQPRGTRLTFETANARSTFRFPEDRYGIGHMVREFRASISGDRLPLTSGEDGLRDLALVLKAYESAARGAPLSV